ncbi:hypothetical protein GCM10007973_08510 [Polymorphobacter multimanifer]|uniref:Uncharacterized protein n=1 Tax=Polymorphobacter multimanifer TaxID=1070431 RepID=A0A841L8Z8_9SPHN|nr:hypothetical protein [Polymorphobacter multimanifer]MBB6228081.1 hypothetical protein [Polymorphobacter multimanifer]GGI73995.1 hypothetical protein GCM10007973_08510 [Polymorphobacter multimanifer]
MDQLRLPFFIFAVALLALAALIELTAADFLSDMFARGENEVPGLAIKYLFIIDGTLLYNLLCQSLSVPVPRELVGRVQPITTLLLSLLALLAGFAALMLAFGLLMLMVGLLLAVPFGTIAYVAGWGSFAKSGAAATLTLVMALKLLFSLFLLLAQQRFLQNKGLLFYVLLSLGLTWGIAFVHALVPAVLISIADAAIAVVIAVIGLVLLLLLFVFAIIGTIKAVASLRHG